MKYTQYMEAAFWLAIYLAFPIGGSYLIYTGKKEDDEYRKVNSPVANGKVKIVAAAFLLLPWVGFNIAAYQGRKRFRVRYIQK